MGVVGPINKKDAVFSPEQVAKASKLAEEVEQSPWLVCISRDKRKAQVIDAKGNSIFGGSWVLSPEEAEKIVALREIFPLLLKSALLTEKTLATMTDNFVGLKEVFSELSNYEGLDVWAQKGLELITAIEKKDD